MSHEITEFAPGIHSFVSARTSAWHKLGTTLESTFDAKQALEHAHLANWNVRKTPLFTFDENQEIIQADNRFATIFTNPVTNKNQFLGDVGSHYAPIQNEAHVDLFNAIVDQSGAVFETAGSLANGRKVFMSMKLPEGIKIGGVDQVDLYLVAMNSHDGSSPFRFIVTPVRVVCANTLAAAVRSNKGSFSIRHVANPAYSIQEARETLNLTFEYVKEFEDEANEMIQKQLDEDYFRRVVASVFGTENAKTDRQLEIAQKHVDGVMSTLATSTTLDGIEGTNWAGYQAVTEYMDHFMDVRKGSDEARAIRALSDTGTKIKQDVFTALAR